MMSVVKKVKEGRFRGVKKGEGFERRVNEEYVYKLINNNNLYIYYSFLPLLHPYSLSPRFSSVCTHGRGVKEKEG